MVAQFQSTTPQLLLNGLQLIPSDWVLTPVLNNKRPYRNNWQNEVLSRDELVQIIRSGKPTGYGIKTGPVSGGLLAIDCDGQSAHDKLNQMGELPKTVAFASGKPGRCQYLVRVAQEYWGVIKTRKITTGKKEQLELRWDGCQSVLPPSVHPDTGSYSWVNSPQVCEVAECPVWLVEFMMNEDTPAVATAQPNAAQQYIDSLQFPIDYCIDVIDCLAPVSRQALNGNYSDGRNDTGAKIARDLIGTANFLDSVGQRYSGDIERIFFDWCSMVGLDKDTPKNQPQTIWKSAQKTNPKPSLDADKIKNIIGWKLYKSQGTKTRSHSSPPAQINNIIPLPQQHYQPTNEEQTLRQLLAQLQEEKDPIKKAVVLSQLRKFGYGDKQVQGLIESTNPKQSKAKFMLPGEILNQSDGLNWLIPGLLPALGTSFLAGAPATGKSSLSYDLAASIKEGEEFLGEMPTETGSVLIVCSDEPLPYVQDKLISRGFYANQSNWGLLHGWDVSQWDELEHAIEKLKPKFILVDSFASIHRGAGFDENSTAAAGTIYKFNNLCEQHNTSILCIHHLNKNKEQRGVDKMRGSTAIAAAACAIWSLSGEGDVRTLTTPKLRGGMDTINFNISLDREEGRFKVIEGNETIQANKPIMARIRELFQRRGCDVRLELPEIMNEVGGSRDSIYKALQRLCGIGELSKTISKADPRKKVYFLSAKYKIPTPPPPTVRSNLSNIMAETITTQGVDILDKIVDNTLDKPKNDDSVQHPNDLSNIMAETDTQQASQTKNEGEPTPCPTSCPTSCPISQTDTQQEVQPLYWTTPQKTEGGRGEIHFKEVPKNTGTETPQSQPFTPGDEIWCYPSQWHFETKYKVKATVLSCEYDNGIIWSMSVAYQRKDKKTNQSKAECADIPGANIDDWVVKLNK
jgi:hypothetical protein